MPAFEDEDPGLVRWMKERESRMPPRTPVNTILTICGLAGA